jgi:hypothetical protein
MIAIIPIGSVVQIKLTNTEAIIVSAMVGKGVVNYYMVEYIEDHELISLRLIEEQIVYNGDVYQTIM